jgi:ATP-dependent RNA helicase DDX1
MEKFLTAAGGGVLRSSGFGFEKKETGKENKYSCCVLAGMRSMEERRRNLEAFKEGDVRFLICTDVAARGIDIQSLPFVINFTLPDEADNYIHRIGRVGRAERMGLAISIVAPFDTKEKVWFHTCASKGASCNNRNLKENGGCTIWYNETDLLEKIERRLDMSIPELRPDYSLPESIASLGVEYGSSGAKDSSTWLSKFHMEQLAPTVRALADMETEAQNMFISYQLKFGKRISGL